MSESWCAADVNCAGFVVVTLAKIKGNNIAKIGKVEGVKTKVIKSTI